MEICILGATGLVGNELLDLIDRAWPDARLHLFASRGRDVSWRDRTLKIRPATDLEGDDAPSGDLAFVALDDAHSAHYCPRLLELGYRVVDKSNTYRLDPHVPLVVAGGEVRWSPDPPAELALRVGKSLPGAVLGSLAEEAFFRGIVFLGLAHALLRRGTPRASVLAALASSLVYAWLHFLAPLDDFELDAWSPLVGFEYFGLVLERYVEPVRVAAMLGLFLVGYSLCRCLARSGSFGLCVGLHAGWFLAAKAGVHLLQLVQPPAGDIGQAKRLLFLGQPWTWLAIASTVVLVEVLLRWMPALVGATEAEVASTATG